MTEWLRQMTNAEAQSFSRAETHGYDLLLPRVHVKSWHVKDKESGFPARSAASQATFQFFEAKCNKRGAAMRTSGRRINTEQFIQQRLLLIPIEHIARFNCAETRGLRGKFIPQRITVERPIPIVFLY